MQCKDVTPLLSPFLDGELDDEQQAAIAAHLESCPHCRKALDSLVAVNDAASSDFLPDPGRKYWKQAREDISSRIKGTGVTYGEDKEPWYRILFPAPALGFAGLAVTAVLVFFVVKYTGQRDTPSSGRDMMVRFEAPAPGQETAAESAPLDESKSVITQVVGASEERLAAVATEREAPPPPATMQEEAMEKEDKTVMQIAGVGENKTAVKETTLVIDGGKDYPVTGAGRRLAAVRTGQAEFGNRQDMLTIHAGRDARLEKTVIDTKGVGSRSKEEDISGMSSEFQRVYREALKTDDLQERFRLWENFISTGPDRSEENRARFKQAAIYTTIAMQDTSSQITIEKAITFLDSVLPSFTDPGQQMNIVEYRDSLQHILAQKK